MFKRIVLATDFSDTAREALTWAQRLAEQHQAELHILHVKLLLQPNMLPVGSINIDQLEAERDATAQQQLKKLADDIGYPVITDIVADFKAATAIADYASDQQADLIVVGSHGLSGLKRVVLGSETHNLLRAANTAVLVIRPESPPPPKTGEPIFKRILAPVDLSPASAQALAFADRLAAADGAVLSVIHAVEISVPSYYPQPNAMANQAGIEDALRQFTKDAKLKSDIKSEVIFGPASYAITNAASEQKVDLILMSRSGLSGWQRLIVGNVTEKVLHSAPCSILILPTTEE